MVAKKKSVVRKVEKFVVLKKIEPMSFAKIHGIIGAVAGLIMGIMFASFGAMMSGVYPKASMLSGLGLVGIIVAPLFYGVISFLAGFIVAWIYNLFASWIGGIKLQLE